MNNNTIASEKINKNQAEEYSQAAMDTLVNARGYDRQDTTAAIKNIDLVSIVQAHGITLKKSGTRHMGLCPFHDEKTPSFFVYPNNSFYCFGCGAGGDAATFIMHLYGCSFPDALERLGIQKTSKPFSPAQTMQINKMKAKRDLVESFRRWEANYSSKLGALICKAHTRLARIKTRTDLDRDGWIYSYLPQWKYHLDILCYGSDQDKYKLFSEVSHG